MASQACRKGFKSCSPNSNALSVWLNVLTFLHDLQDLLVEHALDLDVPVQTLPLDLLHTLTAFPLSCS